MNSIEEFALLIAVAIPMALIAGVNVLLALTGERGTLLLPIPEPLPSGGPAPVDLQPARAAAVPQERPEAPANDEREREAA
ncbi:MAG: hypothetical protein ACXWAC_04715 [Usitatibacter sp.]